MDQQHRLVDVNLLFEPMFDVEIYEETEQFLKYRDIDGVKRIFLKEEATIPTSYNGRSPVGKAGIGSSTSGSTSRTSPPASPRTGRNWCKEYRSRDYPLAIGGYPQGFFGTLVHLLGYENVFVWYHEQPDLIHDILKTFTEIWIAVYAEVLDQVEIDDWEIWEDMSDKKGLDDLAANGSRVLVAVHGADRRLPQGPRRATDPSGHRRRLPIADPDVSGSRRDRHVALRADGQVSTCWRSVPSIRSC